MKKYWLLFVLLLSLSARYGLYADVILTDEQAMELDQTLDELEKTLAAQQKTIDNLQMQNSELEQQLTALEKQANERQSLLEKQEKTLNEAKHSSEKLGLFSILRNILISLCSFGGGILIGLIL